MIQQSPRPPWLLRTIALFELAKGLLALGAAFGLLHALLTVGLALAQHVVGLGITLLATSLASFSYRLQFPRVTTPPTIQPFAEMHWLHIPVLSAQTPLTLLALVLVVGTGSLLGLLACAVLMVPEFIRPIRPAAPILRPSNGTGEVSSRPITPPALCPT